MKNVLTSEHVNKSRRDEKQKFEIRADKKSKTRLEPTNNDVSLIFVDRLFRKTNQIISRWLGVSAYNILGGDGHFLYTKEIHPTMRIGLDQN